jgi:uncharacterized RDD family membrane protein YckC
MCVVMRDGTTPTLGVYFLRWLLLLMDTWGWTGVVVILLNKNNRRLGDAIINITPWEKSESKDETAMTARSRRGKFFIITYDRKRS